MSATDDDCAVKIAVRQRPLREIFQNTEEPFAISYHTSNSNIIIADERPFAFDHVLSQNVTQKEVYDFLVMPLVSKVLQGFNCTALAYGQTGTGKSFTMGLNPESFEGEDMGVIPRCLQEILEQKHHLHLKYEIRGSFIEIYNEKVYDLLGENPAEPIIARGYKYTGGTKKPIENIHDAYTLLIQGTKNRHVRPTKMNPQSSRSHAIFTIYVQNNAVNKATQSCLNLVDLAGSEGVRRTGHQGMALSEGVHINQGLLSIGKVLQAITHGYKVIPYRDSVLSSVLQDSLNPNSYFTLLACISPHREDLSETLSTLRFAQSAKNLKNNPQLNLKLMELKKAKTPFKMSLVPNNKRSMATPTPYKRPFSLVNSKQNSGKKKSTYHGNTFCTPSKKERNENLKLSQTVVGLTPKEKQKIGSVRMPVSKVAPFTFQPHERESLMSLYKDTSLESRPSLINMSTSTAIESRIPSSSKDISPIVRRCMAEMQNTMTSSVLRVLESIKNTNATSSTPQDSCSETLAEQKLRNIIRQELLTIRRENNISDQRVTDNGVRCELFRSSSPIFKIPEIPGVRPMTDSYTSQVSISFQNESISNEEATVLPKPPRRSLRVSLRANSFCVDDSMDLPLRRSKRLSSITEHNQNKRRSIRLAAHKEEPHGEVKKRTKSTKRTRATNTNNLVNNTVIAGYFDEEKESTRRSTKSALEKHQKAILDMLNNASMKELQLLPQIGLKTAFQIVTQRTLHGKFKNFIQVGKLPIWRGQAWERFKAVNNITS